jgi:serine/threonine-protein kinase
MLHVEEMPPQPSSWVVPISDPELPAGKSCGRYELLLPVAQGGMGTVWAARRKGDPAGALVAIKTMLPRYAGEPYFQRMFRIEAEIASRIGHPNVCKVMSLIEAPGWGLCMVMEWIGGSSLQTLLYACRDSGAAVPAGVAARIGAQTARGLHAAHELRDDRGARIGVVHRDVSPHNVIVSLDGTAKIIDFGVAKTVEGLEHPTTMSGQIKGKAKFLSPEQVQCDPLDHRSDIFALGIVLYLLVTGTHPFEANHDLATMRRIALGAPAATPGQIVPGCPPELSAAIMRALAKAPAARFASMDDFAEVLDAIASAAGVGDAEVAAFVREIGGARIAARAAKIEEAARGEHRGSGATPPRALYRALGAAALCALGAALGAAAIAWLRLLNF